MSIGGILLGVINIGIVVLILLMLGALVLMFCNWLNFPISAQVQKLYIGIVALVALYMLVALILGIPSIRVISQASMMVTA